ncbi:MAG TPA: diacylglycerol kinase family protein [Acidimicrobiales bacterium]|nr:diacylglycerol kinase family protein [Acidimicrobiales bacterium]
MRLLLLVNASASSVTPRSRVVIQKALAADHQVAMEETSRRGHAARLAQRAAAEGVDGVVVLGGDGTLNEAANGLAGSHTALGVLPGGSTNVFARTIGASVEPIEATGQLLAAMARGSRRRIGLGQVNGRYFLFHVGMGFDAAVVDQVERRSDLKRYAGHLLFVYATVATWFRHYDHRRPRLSVQADEDSTGAPSYLAICLNTNPYTFLGSRRLNLAPDATLDGELVLVNFRTLRFSTIAGVVVSALGSGRWARSHPGVDYNPGLRRLVVTARGKPFPYQVDGDFVGDTEHLTLQYEPETLDVFLP